MSRAEPSLSDRFTGCLLGLAVGDALGARFEGQSPEYIAQRYQTVEALLKGLPSGELWYTDDTQMAIGVAETVVRLAPCPVLTVPGDMVRAREVSAASLATAPLSRPCLVCGDIGEDLVCETCRNRIRAESLDSKRESERPGAARTAGLTRKEERHARS